MVRILTNDRMKLVGCLALCLGLLAPVALASNNSGDEKKLTLTTESASAKAAFWKGMDDFENIFGSRAYQNFVNATQADPNFGLAHVFVAASEPGLTGEKRAEKISAAFAKLGNASAGEILFATAMRDWNSDNQEAAHATLKAASKLAPDDVHLAYYAGISSGLGSNPAEVADRMKAILDKHPDFAPAANILAYSSWNSGREEDAMRAARKYVALRPDHPNPHDTYAEILQWSGQLSTAAKHYTKALEIDPTFANSHDGLAEVYQMMGDGVMARAELQKAIKASTNEQYKLNLQRAIANSFILDGQVDQGIAALRGAAAGAEEKGYKGIAAIAHHQIAAANALLGDGKLVDEHLAKAAQLSNDDSVGPAAWSAYANLYAGKTAQAKKSAMMLEKKAAENENWSSPSLVTNAMLMIREGKHMDALESLIQADPSSPMTRAVIAECHGAFGNKAEAAHFKSSVLNDTEYSLFDATATFARVQASRVALEGVAGSN